MEELQSDISIKGSKITGTLKHVTDYTDFTTDAGEQEGNFLALDLKAKEGVTIKTQVIGGDHGEVTVTDGFCVYRIKSKDTQKIKVTFEKGETIETTTYDLTGLDCQSA